MPPLQKSIADEFYQFYRPIYGFNYVVSLFIIPALVEMIQRKLAKFNILSHHKNSVSGILGKIFSVLVISTIVTTLNYLNLPILFPDNNQYKPKYYSFIICITAVQFLINYHNKILPHSNLHPPLFNKNPTKLKKLAVKYGCFIPIYRTNGLDTFYLILPWCFIVHFAIRYEFFDERFTEVKFYESLITKIQHDYLTMF